MITLIPIAAFPDKKRKIAVLPQLWMELQSDVQ